jgi:hypothetical protein
MDLQPSLSRRVGELVPEVELDEGGDTISRSKSLKDACGDAISTNCPQLSDGTRGIPSVMLCLVTFLRSGDVGFRRDNDESASCCLLPPTRLLELVWRREYNNDRDNIRGMVD